MEKNNKYYKEKFYLLQKDQETIDYLYKYSQRIKQNKIQEYNNNIELFTLYNEYINSIKELFDHFNLEEDGLYYSIIFANLLFNGYFSYNEQFITYYKKQIELKYKCAPTIITGKACCRHVSDLFNDVFNNQLETNIFYGYMSCFKNQIIPSNSKANHALNIIKHNNKLYAYDITNQILFYFQKENQLKLISNYNEEFITYKPYLDILRHQQSIEDVLKKIDTYKDNLKLKSINYEDFEQIVIEIYQYLKGKNKLLDDYLNKTKTLKKELYTKMLKFN